MNCNLPYNVPFLYQKAVNQNEKYNLKIITYVHSNYAIDEEKIVITYDDGDKCLVSLPLVSSDSQLDDHYEFHCVKIDYTQNVKKLQVEVKGESIDKVGKNTIAFRDFNGDDDLEIS